MGSSFSRLWNATVSAMNANSPAFGLMALMLAAIPLGREALGENVEPKFDRLSIILQAHETTSGRQSVTMRASGQTFVWDCLVAAATKAGLSLEADANVRASLIATPEDPEFEVIGANWDMLLDVYITRVVGKLRLMQLSFEQKSRQINVIDENGKARTETVRTLHLTERPIVQPQHR